MFKVQSNWSIFLLLVAGLSLATGAVFSVMIWMRESSASAPHATRGPSVSEPIPASAAMSTSPSISATAYASPATDPTPSSTTGSVVLELSFPFPKLIIPVLGVRPEQLRDTFNEARSQDRVHSAIDITAPQGTPVVAAADGTIHKLDISDRGGITIYQMSSVEKLVLYYAHLDRYSENLKQGQTVRQGDTIAYVGDTGNAGAGNYHLHFAIWIVTDPNRYWDGASINPYPLLHGKR